MKIELINTGTELLLGRVLNSHQEWICRQLADRGYVVNRQIAIPDTATEIESAVRESLSRADLVVTTGGLGPTSDDLTRDAIARMLGRELRENADTRAQLERYFRERNRAVPPHLFGQTLVPEGATVLPNRHGTAPGLAIEVNPNSFRDGGERSWLIMLPGPRRELRPMFSNFVMPLLDEKLPRQTNFVCQTFRTVGLGESLVQERIGKALARLVEQGLEIGYCAKMWQVDVRLSADRGDAAAAVESAAAIVRERLGSAIFGHEDDELESVVVQLLSERKQTLALAESCTGGNIANRITNVPGASNAFPGGLVTYSNEAKERFLGVRAETLAAHGAVSEEVAREMAEGARAKTGSDFALSVTGVAGPSGGTAEKPVGTVFIALATPEKTLAWKMFNPWDRITFKEVTARQALNELRLVLLEAKK